MKSAIIPAIILAVSWLQPLSAADFYVSPSGSDSNPGSETSPFLTLRRALGEAEPGTTIYLREGVYRPSQEEIMESREEKVYEVVYSLRPSGTSAHPITITSMPGEQVTFDLSDIKPAGRRVIGFYLLGDHWHLKGFDIVGIQVNETGHTQSINVGLFGGSYNTIEQVNMHDGMGIGVYAVRGSHNLVLNCDAYNNYDPVSDGGYGGNCDGFGFHLRGRDFTGNIISGCRAWRNSDDGFDLINNHSAVTIENCWAMENGYDSTLTSRGDGTGFKSGGYGMKAIKGHPAVPRNMVRHCIAYGNKQAGFYANHNLGGLDFIDNRAYANNRNYNMVNRKSIAEAVDVPGYAHHIIGNISFEPRKKGDDLVMVNPEECIISGNLLTPSLSSEDFISLDPGQLRAPRNADGSLPPITFLRLKP